MERPEELLKAIAMPFQASSLLFIGISSAFMALILAVGGMAIMLAIPFFGLMSIWFTQFTFTLIDDAVNGKQETAAASIEMVSPWGDMRCWVHPVLTVIIALLLLLEPSIPRVPVMIGCVLLFPASLGAIALSGRAADALNPLAMVKVMRGLGRYYLLTVLWVAVCFGLMALLAVAPLWTFFQIAGSQLLLLMMCAFIGGALYTCRIELGFEPLVSPERAAEREEMDLTADRQRMIDALYTQVQLRRPDLALAIARQWLEKAAPHKLSGDVKAMLAAGAGWTEKRGLVSLLRGLAPLLLTMRQPGLAFATVEAGLAAAPGFTLEQENDVVRMIHHALQTGRKRLAATLLANYTSSVANAGTPGPELLALRSHLENKPEPTL